VRTAFSWSYRRLDADAARMFRLLGAHCGADISASTLASLAGLSVAEARCLVAGLAKANLVAEPAPDRFRLHDLLRLYAQERSRAEDDATHRQAALARELDHYLHSAAAGDALLDPVREPRTLPPPVAGTTPVTFDGYAAAWTWFEQEHLALVAAVDRAAAAGLYRQAWDLAWSVETFLNRRGLWHDRVACQRVAISAAHRLGDCGAEARARHSLGYANIWLERWNEAETELRAALRLFRQVEEPAWQARSLVDLALVEEWRGDLMAALDCSTQALALSRAVGRRGSEARALNSVGWYHARLQHSSEALPYLDAALALYQELDHARGQADVCDSLGYAYHQQNEHQVAIDWYRRSIALFVEVGDAFHEALVLDHLGDSYHAVGDAAEARAAWTRALEILIELSHGDATRLRAKLT
jgi:tetratricopeptide (TPR) repeat protein